MKQSRTQNAKRNIVSGIINKVVSLGLPFVIRTIVIWKLGAEYLGLSSLFTAILQVLNMAELGFSSAIIFSLYKPMAENDTTMICALMALYRKIYQVVGIIILVFGLAVMPFLDILIKGSYPENLNIYILYIIFLSNTVSSYFFFAYKSVLLTADQRQDVINNVSTISGIIRCILQIIILCVFNSYYLYVICNVAYTIANNVIVGAITKRRYPDLICHGRLESYQLKEIIKQIKGLAIGKIAVTTRNSFDSIMLSMFCGLVDLAIYSNYYYILSTILSFSNMLLDAITAGIGNSLSVESESKNYEDFKKLDFYFNWIGCWCAVCLLCLYQPFMEIWVGKELTAPFGTMLLFCIYFYILQAGKIRSGYGSASGIWYEMRYVEVGEMIVNPLLNLVLGYFWGMNGILIATIITVSIFSYICGGRKVLRHCFCRSAKEYFLTGLLYLFVTTIVGIITLSVCNLVKVESVGIYGELFIRAIICICLPNMILLMLGCCSKRYKHYILELKNRFL